MSAIGASVQMIDGVDRVTGRTDYALNHEVPGMLAGAALGSPYPHAKVIRVDVSRAERLSGVSAVLTGKMLIDAGLDPYFGPVTKDQPALAIDRVRFAGEPVAAVAAVDLDTARAALDLIEVEYEELPAVFDSREALKADAPLVHDSGNLLMHVPVRRGDVEAGFANADLIFEREFSSPPVQHVPLEPHVTVADMANGRVTVWTSSQTPYSVRTSVAEIFHLSLSQVRVIVPTLGGGYGAKCYPRIEPLTAALSWKARRPVRMVLSRAEVFHTTTKHGAHVYLKMGVKRDGTLVACRGICHLNTGAYADVGANVARSCSLMSGPYRLEHLATDVYSVLTNIVPGGAFRGYGSPQIAWAHESLMDEIAASLSRDPLDLRRQNALREGDLIGAGIVAPELHCDAILKDAAEAVGWNEQPPQDGSVRRGKGIALVIKGMMTPSTSSATAKLNSDGSLEVLTSSVDMGQGARTVLGQIAADGAAVPYDVVSVSTPDTESTPYDQTTSSSRTTMVMGTAIRQATEQVREQLRSLAASQMEAAEADLELAYGQVSVRGVPGKTLSFAEVLRNAGLPNLLANSTFVSKGRPHPETGQPHGAAQYHVAAGACEVEVDTDTGRFTVPRFHINTHAGVVVNPTLCQLQLEGSVVFGVGQAAFEEMLYEDGRLVNTNLSDYMVPSFIDAPEQLSVTTMEDEHDGEIHGLGEQCLPPVAPAIANAIARATGVRIRDLPISPERVMKGLRNGHGHQQEDS